MTQAILELEVFIITIIDGNNAFVGNEFSSLLLC